MKEKTTLNFPKSCSYEIFSKGLKNEFETAAPNEPSVLKPLKVYYSLDTFPLLIFNFSYFYLKLLISPSNFLGQKTDFAISVVWDELQKLDSTFI